MRMYVVRFWRRIISEGIKTQDDATALYNAGGINLDEYNAIIA